MTAVAEVSPTFDTKKQEDFVGRVLNDTSAAVVTTLAAIGDRLGLFKVLAKSGPVTSADLASHAAIAERYAREWLGAMASAGYVEYDPATARFTLPPEHVPALAEENGPVFFGGVHQEWLGTLSVVEQLVDAFRSGGGVPQSAYHRWFYEGLERFTAAWFENLLIQQWVPSIPDLQERLRQGARVADIGCGSGRALIKLAQAFPNSRYVGYDVFAPSVEKARSNAREAGVDDRVRFEVLDAASAIPCQFDVITTFDVIHDAVDPVGIIRSIRQALAPDGIYVCLDINCSDKLEENRGPLGALLQGFSVLYCMTTSLASGGAGLGTVGVHERKLRELGAVAGFGRVRRVPLENPFNNLYELRA